MTYILHQIHCTLSVVQSTLSFLQGSQSDTHKFRDHYELQLMKKYVLLKDIKSLTPQYFCGDSLINICCMIL